MRGEPEPAEQGDQQQQYEKCDHGDPTFQRLPPERPWPITYPRGMPTNDGPRRFDGPSPGSDIGVEGSRYA